MSRPGSLASRPPVRISKKEKTKHGAPPVRTLAILPLSLLLLTAPACQDQSSPPPPAPTPPTQAPTPAPGAQARPTPAPQALPQPAHAPSPIPSAPLQVLPALTFAVSDLKPQGPALLQGDHFVLQAAAPSQGRALVGRAGQVGASPGEWFLLDLETGQAVGQRYPRAQLHPALGLLGVSTPEGAALVHLDDGQLVHPRVRLPPGHELARYQLFLDDAIWVVAHDQEGRAFAGRWADPREPALSLTRRLPFAPRSVQSASPEAADFVQGNGAPDSGEPTEQSCVRYRLEAQGQRCLERGVPGAYSPQSYHLGPEWTLWSPGGNQTPRLVHLPQGHSLALEIPGCQKVNFHAALTQPPRALVGCSQGGQGRARAMVLWTPQQRWTWTEPPEADKDARMMRTIGMTPQPVIDGVEWDLERRSSTWWLDMQGARIWTSPPMDPLEHASVARDTLVVLQDPPRLARVDFSRGTVQPLMPAPPCPGGELAFGERARDRITLTCQVQRDPHLYVFTHQWTLVVDLGLRRAWRTPLYPEALLEDGSVLLSDRDATAAESHATFRALHRVTPR